MENWKTCCSLWLKPLLMHDEIFMTYRLYIERRKIFNLSCDSKILMCIIVDEAVSRVFWTGATKSGCAGQFTNCFNQGIKQKNEYSFDKDFASDIGGACVAAKYFISQTFMAKAIPCQSKAFLACHGDTVRSATALNFADVSLFYDGHTPSVLIKEFIRCHQNIWWVWDDFKSVLV